MTTIKIITGHYGSGKTEFAVSLAMQLAAKGRKVALGDLDIVNPYFRSRERAEMMGNEGIRVISSTLGHASSLDLPAVSAEIRGSIADPEYDVILDLGGDEVGARVVVAFAEDIKARGYEMLLVINAYRPETRDLDGVMRYLEGIEYTSNLKFTGLIVNTHMIWDTTTEDVLAGIELARQVSHRSGLPIRYISAIKSALAGLPPDIEGERLPVGMYMRDAWM